MKCVTIINNIKIFLYMYTYDNNDKVTYFSIKLHLLVVLSNLWYINIKISMWDIGKCESLLLFLFYILIYNRIY